MARNATISKKQVEHVAWLARIELTEEEKQAFTKQLNEVLDYFKKINEIDTSNIEPTYHVINLVNVLREDKVEPSLPKEYALRNASQKEDSFIKAPKII
ncbi:MAG: Asp-tRNA(Asn)/Glu-tRNA(Gln) amidotransferase subunit GatC [Candidatus Freyarchaeota archaeon]|nr:Asp-tRNA(Asn)/Glu-tRNA(Gln) amidotransferase subunit GatC [Candidatus Jordarchaeia archaeon]MBS7280608.1 Asp-tRNA(Asn)/Glu-tRNA(Gln) amidotransferase subunit GatC [Candidatus Jordarchaeia archaeon]